MKISGLNRIVTFEKNTTLMDNYGNHINEWKKVFSCHAAISEREWNSENYAASNTVEHSRIQITIRYSLEATKIKSTQYRIIVDSEVYNIIGIDHMNYRNKIIKLTCMKERV